MEQKKIVHQEFLDEEFDFYISYCINKEEKHRSCSLKISDGTHITTFYNGLYYDKHSANPSSVDLKELQDFKQFLLRLKANINTFVDLSLEVIKELE